MEFLGIGVSDIVKRLGVAQGTFYYYFKSKDEILGAILEKNWDEFAKQVMNKLEESDVDSLQKMQMLLGMLFNPEYNSEKETEYFKLIKDASILNRFHQQFDEARIKKLKPIISRIVKEGIEKKAFREIRNPDEVIEIIFYGINMYMHVNYPAFNSKELFIKKMAGLEEVLEVVLGLERGSFCFTKQKGGN